MTKLTQPFNIQGIDDAALSNISLDFFVKLSKIDVINNILKNKIIVDGGSGVGRFIPFFDFCKANTVYSVEPNKKYFDFQKKWLKNKFYFLKNKKITINVFDYQIKLEDFIDKKLKYDTLWCSQALSQVDFEYVLKKQTAEFIFAENIKKDTYISKLPEEKLIELLGKYGYTILIHYEYVIEIGGNSFLYIKGKESNSFNIKKLETGSDNTGYFVVAQKQAH